MITSAWSLKSTGGITTTTRARTADSGMLAMAAEDMDQLGHSEGRKRVMDLGGRGLRLDLEGWRRRWGGGGGRKRRGDSSRGGGGIRRPR